MCIRDSFLYGSCPKAIYIPLMLSAVFLPMKKFKNKKQCWIWKTVVIVACILLMLTFLIPTAGNTCLLYTSTMGMCTNVEFKVIFCDTYCPKIGNYILFKPISSCNTWATRIMWITSVRIIIIFT